jgi:DNA polymerase (family 10)
MDNIEIAKLFNEIADILEIKNADHFRITAYRRAAQVIESLTQDIKDIYQAGHLENIPGVGKNLAKHISDLITKGKSAELTRVRSSIPAGLLELLNINNLGPKKVKFLSKKFNIKSLAGLKKLLASHKLSLQKGWGIKSEQNISEGIRLYQKFSERVPLGEVDGLVNKILTELRHYPKIDRAEICGSFRRSRETVGDLDFLVTAKNPDEAIKFFCSLPGISKVLSKGPTKVNVLLKRGLEADLRVVKPESFGAALYYFTGSKAHNIATRKMGIARGLKINEYGVYKKVNGKFKKIGGHEEMDIFRAIDLPWIPPEMRENLGEIEAAQKGTLPKLITQEDIRGDLHIHSTWSDGRESILTMAQAARQLGYEYMAITDHTVTVGVVHGLRAQEVLRQLKEIEKIKQKVKGIRILSGSEVDIRKDGSLDLPDSILSKLDVVLASVHASFKMSKTEMTKRLLKAIQNPYVHIIGHPSTREINHREPIEIDWDVILRAAQKSKTALEINASWKRLDLNDVQARMAKNFGVKLVISTDSHNTAELNNMKLGITTARRGWIEAKDVLNSLSLAKFLKIKKS